MQDKNYRSIEARIEKVIPEVKEEEKPNVVTLACKFGMPQKRLRACLKHHLSRQQREATNRRLSADLELVLCQYLDRLDKLGISP